MEQVSRREKKRQIKRLTKDRDERMRLQRELAERESESFIQIKLSFKTFVNFIGNVIFIYPLFVSFYFFTVLTFYSYGPVPIKYYFRLTLRGLFYSNPYIFFKRLKKILKEES